MKYMYSGSAVMLGLSTLLAVGISLSSPGKAQAPYMDTRCGSWVNDVWVPNGNCAPDTPHRRHDTVAGTITSVSGHLVTVQQTGGTLVVNDQPALDRQQTGRVAVGRQVVAYGYWMDGTFYATGIY